ncbi:hypothetical protein R5H30_01145 [Sulfitobacter sp. D35]|uniref:hypothetical protein n=1 Tax=Sulfitobacter sp. D35 TaxID=3083252 RepID=UPI00296E780E|nr:hypothetical protein [Sulfitobacter sp. D35]MDW4496570.1 hypothetical protein [Sulfitobacter sp. D35]
MKSLLAILPFAFLATAASGHVPSLNASCPTNIDVHADEGGPVYINGHESELKASNENYYEAIHGNITVSLSINPDGTAQVSYTRKKGGNGICKIHHSHFGRMEKCPVDVSEADRARFPACN